MINTVRVVTLGLIFASVLGLFVGVFLLSSNWLIRSVARTYVEALRNTPMLVQIFIWYFVVMFSLPKIQDAITFPAEGITFISLRIALWLVLWFVLWALLARLGGQRRAAGDAPIWFHGVGGGFGIGFFRSF